MENISRYDTIGPKEQFLFLNQTLYFYTAHNALILYKNAGRRRYTTYLSVKGISTTETMIRSVNLQIMQRIFSQFLV